MEPSLTGQSFALESETAHTILNSALDAHILMNPAGTIVGWNPQSEIIFGWSAKEVLGRRLSDVIIPPAYRAAHERGIQTFHATGKGAVLGRRIEVEGWHRDQRQFPIELTVTSANTEQGCLFSAFVRDITARKKAEQSLKDAKERAEQAARDRAGILAAVDVFCIYVDASGVVTEWTAMAEQTFGLTRNMVLDRQLQDLPIAWNWDEVLGMMQLSRTRIKVRMRQDAGADRLIGMTVTPVVQGHGTGYIFMGKDITEQVKLDHEIAQSQKLESIGQLAAGIAHEINTPTQFVGDNTMFLNESFIDLLRVLQQYQVLLEAVKAGACSPALIEACREPTTRPTCNTSCQRFPRRSSSLSTGSPGWEPSCRP